MMQGHLHVAYSFSSQPPYFSSHSLSYTRVQSLGDLEVRQVFDPFAVGAAVRTWRSYCSMHVASCQIRNGSLPRLTVKHAAFGFLLTCDEGAKIRATSYDFQETLGFVLPTSLQIWCHHNKAGPL